MHKQQYVHIGKIMKGGAGGMKLVIWEQGAQNCKREHGVAENHKMEQGAMEIIREPKEKLKGSRKQREMKME